MSINAYQMEFNGEILERGFWLYIWKITEGKNVHLYVGRTGDSSSAHASSPFNRIGQHLDFRKNAKGNSLAKRLSEAKVNPRKSRFRMLALGPIYTEQETFEEHKPFRDEMATFEYELARNLKSKGYSVLGVHHKGAEIQAHKLKEVITQVTAFLNNESS